ncbi:hypothetical protein FDECE_7654 [Fusarium decemcellulare]|nr:hypothetical protein FDECE_7654 [Fusarium decemcellulare]
MPFLACVVAQRITEYWQQHIWAKVLRGPGSEHAFPDSSVERGRRPSASLSSTSMLASDAQQDGWEGLILPIDVQYDSDESDLAGSESSDSESGETGAEGLHYQIHLIEDTEGSLAPWIPDFDIMMAQLPTSMASHIFADAMGRLLWAPLEAMSLRLLTRNWRSRLGLPDFDILEVNLWNQPSRMLALNFAGVQTLHLALLTSELTGRRPHDIPGRRRRLLSTFVRCTASDIGFFRHSRRSQDTPDSGRTRDEYTAFLAATAATAAALVKNLRQHLHRRSFLESATLHLSLAHSLGLRYNPSLVLLHGQLPGSVRSSVEQSLSSLIEARSDHDCDDNSACITCDIQ